MTPSLTLTSAEKVLYRFHYEFSTVTLGLSEAQAEEEARNKILRTRALLREPEMRKQAQRERGRV